MKMNKSKYLFEMLCAFVYCGGSLTLFNMVPSLLAPFPIICIAFGSAIVGLCAFLEALFNLTYSEVS